MRDHSPFTLEALGLSTAELDLILGALNGLAAPTPLGHNARQNIVSALNQVASDLQGPFPPAVIAETADAPFEYLDLAERIGAMADEQATAINLYVVGWWSGLTQGQSDAAQIKPAHGGRGHDHTDNQF